MNEPLTKSQRELRGRAVRDMSVAQLRDWIGACNKMERSVGFNKARRSWKLARSKASAELARRGAAAPSARPGDA